MAIEMLDVASFASEVESKRRISVAFDGNGKAYIRGLRDLDEYVEKILTQDSLGKWVEFPAVNQVNEVLKSKWPSWNKKSSISASHPQRRIAFDRKNNIYFGIDAVGESGSFEQALIAASSDSVNVISLKNHKIRYIRLETPDGNRPGYNLVDGMPTIIGSDVRIKASYHPIAMRPMPEPSDSQEEIKRKESLKRRRGYRFVRSLFLLRIYRNSSGELEVSKVPIPDPDISSYDIEMELSPEDGPEEKRMQSHHVVSIGASGSGNVSVTSGTETHVFWSAPGKINTDQVHIFANTFDYVTGKFLYSKSLYVGTLSYHGEYCRKPRGCNFDTHCHPAVTMDMKGYIHCVISGHNHAFRYLRTQKPNDISSWVSMDGRSLDNASQLSSNSSFSKNVGRGSYANLVSDIAGNLHLVWRSKYQPNAAPHELLYSRKNFDSDNWQSPQSIFRPVGAKDKDPYHNYYHSLQHNQSDGKLYLSWSVYEDIGINEEKHVFTHDPKIVTIKEARVEIITRAKAKISRIYVDDEYCRFRLEGYGKGHFLIDVNRPTYDSLFSMVLSAANERKEINVRVSNRPKVTEEAFKVLYITMNW